MQLNIKALNSMRKIQPDVPEKMYSDYYVTLTISRDQNASSDDVAFTCTSNQNKVSIMIVSITRGNQIQSRSLKESILSLFFLYQF